MKKLSVIIGVLLLTINVLSQAPEKMSYQFVVRNNNSILITNSTVSVVISILQTSPTGIPVYVEKHSTTTSINGLATIEIGGGWPITGTFATIDWANGPYFLKTETDASGGSNYNISGTSQLLSVPYALYAKTAENVIGGISETDPVFGASPAFMISSGNIIDWGTAFGWGDHAGLYKPISYVPSWNEISSNPFLFATPATDQLIKFNGTNWINFTPDFALANHVHADATTTVSGFMSGADKTKLDGLENADGSETIITAGTDVTVSGIGTTADPYIINSTAGNNNYHQGDLYGGGIVFYVDQTGEHGLILSLIDLSVAQIWSDVNLLIGPAAQSTWDGQTNTTAIVNQAGMTSSAAKLCDDYINDDYGTGIYSDWYLPAQYELGIINTACYIINKNIETDGNPLTTPFNFECFYWTSVEYNNNKALVCDIISVSLGAAFKNSSGYVRAIRAF